jgi:RHS repeat-associated protein
LGSVTAMSDDVGQVVNSPSAPADAQVLGYDPWGARRNPDGKAAAPASFSLQVGHREFTGQETIPNVGLINLNGRVYDPVLARFLSPDPHIQDASDLQSYNRYSYVLNNPLKYTDPTGYWSFLGLSGESWADIGIGLVGIAVCAGTSGAGCSIAFALASAALNTTVAIASGAGFGQIFTSLLVGAVSGMLGGALGSGLGSVIGNQIGGTAGTWIGSVVGGAASGALAAVFASPTNGFSGLGRNVLVGAVVGAGMSAANLGCQQAVGVTQASAGNGIPGAGSGANDAELQARAGAAAGEAAADSSATTYRAEIDKAIDATLAEGGYTGPPTDEEQLGLLNLATRRHIAAAAEALAADGGPQYGTVNEYHGRLGGEYKCNVYVRDALNSGGAPTPIESANTWGNPKSQIPGWDVVDDGSVESGDVIGFQRYGGHHGHVGVIDFSGEGPPSALASSTNGVISTGVFWKQNPNAGSPVVWRWTGD